MNVYLCIWKHVHEGPVIFVVVAEEYDVDMVDFLEGFRVGGRIDEHLHLVVEKERMAEGITTLIRAGDKPQLVPRV